MLEYIYAWWKLQSQHMYVCVCVWCPQKWFAYNMFRCVFRSLAQSLFRSHPLPLSPKMNTCTQIIQWELLRFATLYIQYIYSTSARAHIIATSSHSTENGAQSWNRIRDRKSVTNLANPPTDDVTLPHHSHGGTIPAFMRTHLCFRMVLSVRHRSSTQIILSILVCLKSIAFSFVHVS